MKVTKAIEVLTETRNMNINFLCPDRKDALKLGASALRQIQRLRLCNYGPAMDTLAGETEE